MQLAPARVLANFDGGFVAIHLRHHHVHQHQVDVFNFIEALDGFTAKAMKDDQERCLQAGSNDYLAKPIDLDRLFSLIRVWLPKMERL